MSDLTAGSDLTPRDPLPAYKTESLLRADLNLNRERYRRDRAQLGDAPAVLLRLLDLITNQELPVGSTLPARRTLLELYDVKKESIEQVWRHLGDAGALHSRKRAGTVVAAIPDDTKLAELRGWAHRRATPSKPTPSGNES